jgi:hypothetical protein
MKKKTEIGRSNIVLKTEWHGIGKMHLGLQNIWAWT